MKKQAAPKTSTFSLFNLIWIPIIFVGGFIVANFNRPMPGPTVRADNSALTEAVDSLAQQVAELERRVVELSSARPVAPSRPQPAAAPATAKPTATDDAPDDKPKKTFRPPTIEPLKPDPEDTKAVVQTASALDTQIDDEPIDESWAGDQERQIQKDLAGDALGAGYVVDAKCRSSMCKVQLEHPDPSQMDQLFLMLLSKPGFAGRRLFTQQSVGESGTGKMTIYVARAGRPLATDPVAQAD